MSKPLIHRCSNDEGKCFEAQSIGTVTSEATQCNQYSLIEGLGFRIWGLRVLGLGPEGLGRRALGFTVYSCGALVGTLWVNPPRSTGYHKELL